MPSETMKSVIVLKYIHSREEVHVDAYVKIRAEGVNFAIQLAYCKVNMASFNKLYSRIR